MSETMSKSGIRGIIPSLKGKSKAEALAFFRDKLGKPSEYYSDDDWYYDSNEYQNIPVFAEGEWGIETVLECTESYNAEGLSLSMFSIATLTKRLVDSFGVDPDSILIFSYNWYNGVDEPKTFKEKCLYAS